MYLLIGVDYGISGDTPIYTVGLKENGKLLVVDTGNIADFDFKKYEPWKHHMEIIGENKDVERFKKQFKI